MTDTLFWQDPYLKEFDATVVRTKDNSVILDRTCFFPQGGGQLGDIGWLGPTKVLKTIWDTDKKDILHIVEDASWFQPNARVQGVLDWKYRYRTMRNHAASHIMEALLKTRIPTAKLTYSQVGPDGDVSSYETPERISETFVQEIEDEVNAFIARTLPIERQEDENHKGYWYWRCGDIAMPCGGTHPRNTDEIGSVRVTLKKVKGKKMTIWTVVADL